MKRILIAGLVALIGCEVAPHVAPDTPSGGNEAVQNQGGVDESPAGQSGPTPPPKKPDPGVPLPKPTPPPAQQPDAGASSDNAPDTEADAAMTDEGATDEEEFEGCGPMGDEPVMCEWNNDCPFDGESWHTNACVDSVCVQDPPAIVFDYALNGVNPLGVCVQIKRLGSDGLWHKELHPTPYIPKLEDLCSSYRADAYIDPSITPALLVGIVRLSYNFIACDDTGTEVGVQTQLPWNGMSVWLAPKYLSYQFQFKAYKEPYDETQWVYISGLGNNCNDFDQTATSYVKN